MAKPKHKILYAARVNLNGLYSDEPLKVKYDIESEKYWDNTGDFGVDGPGIDSSYGCVTYVSDDKSDVIKFIMGAAAVMHILRDFIGKDDETS